jgi:hypothetical protein
MTEMNSRNRTQRTQKVVFERIGLLMAVYLCLASECFRNPPTLAFPLCVLLRLFISVI